MAGGLHREPRDRRRTCTADVSDDSDPERLVKKKASRKQHFYTHFSKRPQLRGLQAKQDYEGSLQEVNMKFSTSSTEVW